jgi:hypothetical protein
LGASSELVRPALRLGVAGAAVAVLVWAAGWGFERARFGASDEESVARIEVELRQRFDESAARLESIAGRAATDLTLTSRASRDDGSIGRLFDGLAAILPAEERRSTGITVYAHPGAVPLAWIGGVSELPRERIDGPAALFVTPGGRLIQTQPVSGGERSTRIGTIIVEQIFGESPVAPASDDALVLTTSIAPVVLRPSLARVATQSPYDFLIPGRNGQVLMEAEVKPRDLASAHDQWRARTMGVSWSIVGLTLLL